MKIYFDGSWSNKTAEQRIQKCNHFFSWGIVIAGAGEDLIELHGQRTLPVRNAQRLSGHHEIIAFVEAALYAWSHCYDPKDILFVTDDEVTVYGSYQARENGWASCLGMADRLEECFGNLVQSGWFDERSINVARHFIQESRFQKVKGHKKVVYNLRCDYLAKHALGIARGSSGEGLLAFDDWCKHGFTVYSAQAQMQQWYPPFTATLESVQ